MRVFITGGTGLVGIRLVKLLRDRGDDVLLLTRRPDAVKALADAHVHIVGGDPVQPGPWMDAIAECDAVIHLAGEGIFGRRWSQAFKDLLYSSRIKSTENIVAALSKTPPRSRMFICGSAIGFYGPHGDEELTEESIAGNDFLAKICFDWERAAQAATAHGIRVATVRTGIVLDPAGGALAKMLTPFKLLVGGPIGSGRQFMSWIHNDDLCRLFLHILDHPELSGPFNGTAPTPVSNRDFSTALGKVLGRPSFLPTPGFALRVLLGESANIITQGQRVLPRKALAGGFVFKFNDVESALRDLLAK